MMAEAKPFTPVKLICGIISSRELFFKKAEDYLFQTFGAIDLKSPLFEFNFTGYYQRQMGKKLKRKFISFDPLYLPEKLSEIKVKTNTLEDKIREELKVRYRAVNIDPGYLTPSALIIATVKDFAHRIPLQCGIYAHLELLFTKAGIKTLEWTYPDFKTKGYQKFFLAVRKIYLEQLQKVKNQK